MKNAFYSELLDRYFLSEDELNTEEAKVKKAEAEKLLLEQAKEAELEELKALYVNELDAKNLYIEAANKFNDAKSEFVRKYGYVRITLSDDNGQKKINTSTEWEAPKLKSSGFLDDLFNWMD